MQCNGIERNNIQHLHHEKRLQNLLEVMLFIQQHLMKQTTKQPLQCMFGVKLHRIIQVNNKILLDGCEEVKVLLQQQIDGVQNGKKMLDHLKYITSFIDDELQVGFQIQMLDLIHQQHNLSY